MLNFIISMFCSPTQIIGTIGTLLCLLSYCMKNESLLRIVSIVSGIVFILYDIIIASSSLLLLNVFCVNINIYKIIKIKKNSKKLKEKIC